MNKKLTFESTDALKTLGANLALARKRRGWRQTDLKERTGLSRATIQKIEAGDPGVSFGNYMLLIAIYGGVDSIKNTCHPEDDSVAYDHVYPDIERVRAKRILDNDF